MTAGTIETIEQDSYSRDFWKREAMKKDKRIKSLEAELEKQAEWIADYIRKNQDLEADNKRLRKKLEGRLMLKKPKGKEGT
jgi:regulator of replication initiation timing